MVSNNENAQQTAKAGPGDKVKNYIADAVTDEAMLDDLHHYLINYCHSIGNLSLWNDRKTCNDISVTSPLSLLPSPFPLELFEQAKSVQQALSELYFRISLDHDFLVEAYRDVVKADKWIARQVEMLEKIKAEGIHQPLTLQLQRADYMSHWNEQARRMELKNVEVNIGQIGGPGAATQTSKLHKRMLHKLELLHGGPLPVMAKAVVPENNPRRGMAETMLYAWQQFGDEKAVVVFCNQPDLFPVCHYEQLQFMQFELEKLARAAGHRVNVLRMTLQECAQRMHLNVADWSLMVDGNKRVALVHMAYGYLPDHFPSDKEWQCRLDMERSTAIISPNIRMSLAGTKKIQQVLAKPGVIERFLPNQPETVAALRSTFTGLWGLEDDDANIRAVIQDAIKCPKKYVMKAQLGAGKGNYFDDTLANMLKTMTVEERGAYILQQKIWPVVVKNYMKRAFHAPVLESVVSEMGIYGTMLGTAADGGKVLWNRVEGYLVRSKIASANQGGVSEGSGVVDSFVLFPESEFLQK